MFKNYKKSLSLVSMVAVAVMLCMSKAASAANNPVVGKWSFAAFSYDSRSFSASLPAAWNKGVLTLNNDFTLILNQFQSSNVNGPKGNLTGNYTITSDGQFYAIIKDQNPNDSPVTLSGQLDKQNEMIVSSLTINPQQPAIVTLIRQAKVLPSTLLGTWSGHILGYNTNPSTDSVNAMRWILINSLTIKSDKTVLVVSTDSQGKQDTTSGIYEIADQSLNPGQVNIKLYSSDQSKTIFDLTVQISPSGEMGSVVFNSENTNKIIGMGNLIKQQNSITYATHSSKLGNE